MSRPLLKLQIFPPGSDEINPYTGDGPFDTFSLYYETEDVHSDEFPRYIVPRNNIVAGGTASEANMRIMSELVSLWNGIVSEREL